MLKSFLLKMYLVVMAICGIVILTTSCSKDEAVVPVSGVILNDTDLLLILGQKQPMIAQIAPANATNKSVKWESSVEAVATVNGAGQIEAKSVGTTVITVTTLDGDMKATCEVTVQKPIVSVTGISLNKTVLPLLVGQKELLLATITPEEATVKMILWESSNPVVASVNELGEVEALKVGTSTLTATTLDGEKKATCEITVDASQFTVTFESNGGSKVNDVVVDKGEKLAAPATPIMVGGPGEGLYLGVINPNVGSFSFDGWYTDEALKNKYDFNTPVINDLKLYAKWVGDVPEPINISAATGTNVLEKTYNYLNTLSLSSPKEYTLVLTSDIANPILPGNFKNANVSLLLVGKGEERVLSKSGAGNLFLFEGGTLILGNNIKITGTGYANNPPLYLMGTGKLIMKEGSKISDIPNATGNAAAVYVNSSNSTFTMEGGEICNNTVERTAAGIIGAAVCISWGKFYMNGGRIAGNKAITPMGANCIAGGVYINNWNHFHKTGGVIEGNTAVITATQGVTGKTGQQVFFSANNGSPAAWRKVDADLKGTDNITTDDTSNPLWKPTN